MTVNENSFSEIGGATKSVPQTRIFISKKYGFRIEKKEDGLYVLSGEPGRYETRDFEVLIDLVQLYCGKRTAQLLRKRLG